VKKSPSLASKRGDALEVRPPSEIIDLEEPEKEEPEKEVIEENKEEEDPIFVILNEDDVL